MYSHVDTVKLICDECESLDGVVSYPRPGKDNLMEYYCRDCKAEWVDYV